MNPEDRREAARKCIESVGGKLHGFWYAFGAYDGYNLWEAPDNISMAAVAIALGGGGALSKIETTSLLTVEETLDALGRAQAVAYRPPGAQPSGMQNLPPAASFDEALSALACPDSRVTCTTGSLPARGAADVRALVRSLSAELSPPERHC